MQTGSQSLVLGVDAGGSSCRARLTSADGAVVGEGKAGPANAFSDPDGSWHAIRTAIGAAYSAAGLSADGPFAHACLGVAGLDPLEPTPPPQWPLDAFSACVVETDAYIALYGAHAGEDGAVLVVGTGVVGLAKLGHRRYSIGGYGAVLSDEGGGAWLGREAARRMLWSIDGRLQWSELTRAIHTRLGGVKAAQEWARVASAADFAMLAPLIIDANADGDVVAQDLMEKSGMLLGRVVERLAECGADRISVLGGLASFLTPHIDFGSLSLVPPQGNALDGAVRLASRLANHRMTKGVASSGPGEAN